MTKIERDYGSGDVRLAYEYGYNSDDVRVWQRDVRNGQEYRYVCRIGCGGVPMRVYNRPTSGGSWTSVEDYLPAGNALGYNQNWRYRYSGGELLMMTASGEPSAYYPMDTNGLAVQNAPAQPCICAVVVPVRVSVCSPLGYGCGDDDEDCIIKCRRDGKTGRDFFKCLAKCLGIEIADKIIDDRLEKACIKHFCKVFPGSHQCANGINPCTEPERRLGACFDCCDIKFACCLGGIRNGGARGAGHAAACDLAHKKCHANCQVE